MNIIQKPILTEKFTKMGEKMSRYGFIVDKGANKIEIRRAIEELYNVSIISVNTIVNKGKAKSRFTKTGVSAGRTNTVKKAIVTLQKGDAIDFYSNI